MRNSSIRVAALVVVLTAAFPPSVAAQEKTVGLVAAFPIDAGVFWQASERLAFRVDAGVFSNTFQSSSRFPSGLGGSTVSFTTTSRSTSTSLGLSALFTIRNEDNLRIYVAPRVSMNLMRQSSETDVDGGAASSLTFARNSSDSSTGYGFAAMAGGQYRLHDRVAVFAESGVEYVRSAFPQVTVSLTVAGTPDRDDSRDRSTSIGTRGNVGLVFFF